MESTVDFLTVSVIIAVVVAVVTVVTVVVVKVLVKVRVVIKIVVELFSIESLSDIATGVEVDLEFIVPVE